jgi:hypothetical protein
MIEINSSFLSNEEDFSALVAPKRKQKENVRIPGLQSRPQGLKQSLQKSSENSQFIFFRLLRLVSRYRTEYFEGLADVNVPAQPLLLIKNFNPYFVLGFVTPYLHSALVVTKRYKFQPPFHPECNSMTDQEYLNAIRACVLNKALIRQVVRKGDFIRKKHLTVKETTPKLEVTFANESDFSRFISAKGKVPLIIVDCSDFELSEMLSFKERRIPRRFPPFDRDLTILNRSIVRSKERKKSPIINNSSSDTEILINQSLFS